MHPQHYLLFLNCTPTNIQDSTAALSSTSFILYDNNSLFANHFLHSPAIFFDLPLSNILFNLIERFP